MYLTTARLDIMFGLSVVVRFMHQLHEFHWREAKRILKYVSGTKFFGLFYNTTNNSNVVAYTVTNWEGIFDDQKSTLGYVFLFGGILFLGEEKKQPTVSFIQMKKNI